MEHEEYEACGLCPRGCGKNRNRGELGVCRVTSGVKIARAALHMWEEPCISGEKGSGAVFFSGCTLHCLFCQNRKISGGAGKEITEAELSEAFLDLQKQGAANINLVTAGHFAPSVAKALKDAKMRGLTVPILYNTSGYETVETLQLLSGLIDIYLPDYKYTSPELAKKYSGAADYPEIARRAIAKMFRQVGEPEFDEEGYLLKGVVVRHLCLPGETKDSKECVKYLYETYGDRIFISIMNQYTPPKEPLPYPNLNRKLTGKEYDEVVDFAIGLGVENGYIQEGDTAEESFIPEFETE